MSTEVIGVGLAALDHRMVVPEFPCREGMTVSSQYRVEGGGHQLTSLAPGPSPMSEERFGARNRDIETAEEVWAFFRNYALR